MEFVGIFIVIVFVGVLLHILAVRKQSREFNERFPPISDEEFVARCTPGTNPKVALKVRRIVAYNLGVEYERIYPSTRFAEDIGAD